TDPESLNMGDVDIEEVRQLFAFLEFRNENLNQRLAEVLGDQVAAAAVIDVADVIEAEVTELTTPDDAVRSLVALAAAAGPLAVACRWAGQEARSELEGIALVVDPAGAEVA